MRSTESNIDAILVDSVNYAEVFTISRHVQFRRFTVSNGLVQNFLDFLLRLSITQISKIFEIPEGLFPDIPRLLLWSIKLLRFWL